MTSGLGGLSGLGWDGRGSRGVYYIKNKKNIKSYLDASFKTTEKKTLILQEYISGTQLSTESLV